MARAPAKPPELADGPAKLAAFWISEVSTSERAHEKYWKRCRKLVQRYRNDETITAALPDKRRFSILWSNVQTLAPAVYARTPQAVVTRRFKDQDPLARMSSDVLERASNYSLSAYDFDGAMQLCRDNYLLLGRGQAWARYVPKFKDVLVAIADPAVEAQEDDLQISQDQDAARQQVVDYEEVVCDHLNYDDFGTNPARTWDEVWMVWRRAHMDRTQLVERFGAKLGKAIPLDWMPRADEIADPDSREAKSQAAIYEIWDKRVRKAYWVSKSYNAAVLDERDDPLGLTDFFPCPRPLMATCAPDSVIPIPDYVFYQDQAEELDELTNRIAALVNALQVKGVYDSEHGVTLANVFQSPTNYLIPVEKWAMLKDGGGMRGVIEWFPVEKVAEVLRGCFETRQQILNDIYEITGIADILRGASDPDETAKAQGIKAQWGSLRVRDRQKEMARFCRDVVRIKAEIIAEKFAPETLATMTGLKMFPTAQDKALAGQQLQQMQQAQQAGAQVPPPPPEVMEMMDEPTWEEVIGLIRSNARRGFSIDIETDSTIEPDEQEAKGRMIEYVSVTTEFLTAAATILPGYPKAAPLFAEIMKESARVFRVSRPLEEVIERVFGDVEKMEPVAPDTKPGPPPPDPAEQQASLMTAQARVMDAQTKAQDAQVSAQSEQQRTALDGQLGAADVALRAQELKLKQEALRRDPEPQGIA